MSRTNTTEAESRQSRPFTTNQNQEGGGDIETTDYNHHQKHSDSNYSNNKNSNNDEALKPIIRREEEDLDNNSTMNQDVLSDARTSVRKDPKTVDASYESTTTLVRTEEDEDDNDDLKMSIEDAIESLEMGRFQGLILIAAGLCFAADAMEVLLLSFLAVVLQAEWDLSDDETASITSSVFIGAGIGTLISGYLGDKFGRKPMFCMTAALICVFGFATAFTHNIYSLVFCRFMVGFGVGGVTVPFDTLAEFVPSSHRGRDLLLIEYFWTGGTLLVPLVAFFTLRGAETEAEKDSEWRWFVIVLGIPCLVSCIVSFMCVPESPRWLLAKGKHDQALKVLRAAAEMNGKNAFETFPPGTILDNEEDEEDATNLGDLFRKEWMWTTILLWLCWGGFAITYFGTIIAVTMIFASDNHETLEDGVYQFDYLAIMISASSEIAGTTIALVAIDRVGRIPTQVVSYIGGGISMFILSFLAVQPDGSRGLMITMGFLARMFFMGGSCTTWVSTAEIMPTEIRATGHSWANAFARMAGAASPYIVSEQRPYTFSGAIILAVSLFTAAVTSRLPETKGHAMGLHSKELENGLEVVSQHHHNHSSHHSHPPNTTSSSSTPQKASYQSIAF